MAFSVYISHNTSPWELAHVYVLANEARQPGLDVFIPDRTWNPHPGLPPHISEALSRADVVLLFATNGGRFLDWVNKEISAIGDKPLVALIEPGIQVQGIPEQNIVRLDRQNITESTALALKRLQSFRLDRDMANIVGGFLIGTLALLVLRALTRRD